MAALHAPSARRRSAFESVRGVVTDSRVLAAVGQIVFVIVLAVALSALSNQILTQLRASNTTPNFGFLATRAGFDISNAGEYTPDDTYWQAFLVGVRNTLSIVSVGLIAATVLGVVWGVLLLSSNWLLRNVTRAIVEILRNLPLVIVIVVGYFAMLTLPVQREALALPADGVLPIPVRLIGYGIAAVLVWNFVRQLPPARHALRALIVPAFIMALVTFEVLFIIAGTRPGMLNAIYSGVALSDAELLATIAGLIIGLLGIAAARNLSQAARGTVIGVIIGAILFFTGVMPRDAIRLETSPVLYLSNRGLVYPSLTPTARFAEWAIFVLIGLVCAVILVIYLGRVGERTGQPRPRVLYGIGLTLAFALIGWGIVTSQPLPTGIAVAGDDGALMLMTLDDARAAELLTEQDELLYASAPLHVSVPERQGLRFVGGVEVSENYIALLVTLVIYTAAFIAEIVRAGILAVPKGQIEAARALGLNYSQMLQMVVLPQALRVIIPPLGNQYLNLAKNSSLAIAIAYADVFAVTNTMINQSGQSVTGIVMLMVTYLIISLAISACMNWVNGRFQIKTR